MTALNDFRQSLKRDDLVAALRAGLIGDKALVDGPYGKKPLLYADYVASGRALTQVEGFVLEHVLPYYANTHTETSFCGAYSTQLREEARAEIGRIVGAGADCHVIFSGSGATSGLNRVVALLDIPALIKTGQKAVVLVGPYEHHSNLLPWRESGAEVIEIAEADTGGPDLAVLESELQRHGKAGLVVGAFSAMSNVTGIVTDSDAVTRLLKRYHALAVWDYAGGAPYIAMQMQSAPDAAKDAIVFSAHKFPGGPGASGVLVLREGLARCRRPTQPGGGTVAFVSPWTHVYSADVVAREEAGTPNVVGDIRAALVMIIKEAIGQTWIDARNAALRARALDCWRHNPALKVLGNPAASAMLPIFAFRVRNTNGAFVPHQIVTRLLSEAHGIQARGGCACAGPYGHRLLGIGYDQSERILAEIGEGNDVAKPGWVRMNLSYLLSDDKADEIIRGVDDMARQIDSYARNPQVILPLAS